MERHEICGILRLEHSHPALGCVERPKPWVALVDGNFVTHLGRWLAQYKLEGKRVKITVETLGEK